MAPAALTLALLACLLALVSYMSLGIIPIMERLGSNPTPQDIRRLQQEVSDELIKGTLKPHRISVASGLVSGLMGLAAIALAIQSFIRRENRPVMATTACILGLCCSCCAVPLLQLAFGTGTAPQVSPDQVPSSQPTVQ
jgi:hypothetical protein